MSLCQSCRKNPIEIVERNDNPDYPYRVCKNCYNRLSNHTLRPREYFNLKSLHGDTYALHSDFYDVLYDAELGFPKLDKSDGLKEVVDYAIVQRWLTDDVTDAIKQFDKNHILVEIDKRITTNRILAPRLYEVAARTLGTFADKWILSQWRLRTEDTFPNFSEALAKCLEESEGFQLYALELDKIEQAAKLVEKMLGLIDFQSRLGLQWIEANINRVVNISDQWGYVAVASRFDWSTAKRWLNGGRPLSLIALDALANCAVTSTTQNSTIWLKEHPQRLLAPASVDEMNEVLKKYEEKDRVPRVRQKIMFITSHWSDILKHDR